jgi:hypothetical protein
VPKPRCVLRRQLTIGPDKTNRHFRETNSLAGAFALHRMSADEVLWQPMSADSTVGLAVAHDRAKTGVCVVPRMK